MLLESNALQRYTMVMEPPVPVVPVIGYAMPDVRIRYGWLHSIARVCGWTPLLIGVGALIAYIPTRDPIFAVIGIWTLIGGLIASAVGVTCLAIYFFTNRLSDPVLRQAVNRRCKASLILLIANYPAAILCIMVVANLERY